MTDMQKFFAIALVVVSVVLLYFIGPVLAPFFISALLAYLGDPLVDRLETYKLSRTFAVIVVFTGLFFVLLLLPLVGIPLLEQQIKILIGKLPSYMDWLQNTVVPWIQTRLGLDANFFNYDELSAAIKEHWQKVGGLAANIAGSVSRSGIAVLEFIVNLLLIPVVTFYLLRDWDLIKMHLQELLPRAYEPTISRLARECDDTLGAFMRGQLMVMAALGIVYSLGLWLVGLDLALLIGMLAGLVSFVPYLGFIVGIVVAGVATVVQFQDILHLALIVGVFTVGQTLESMLFTPWLVGDRIGLHPVMVIFAVLAGGQLFGFIGILLALPVAAVTMVLLRDARVRYVRSPLYARKET